MLGRPRAWPRIVRWHDEPSGGIAGERFGPGRGGGAAEPLTDWLLAAACRQARRWRRRGLPACTSPCRCCRAASCLERSRPPARAPPRQRRHAAGLAGARDRRGAAARPATQCGRTLCGRARARRAARGRAATARPDLAGALRDLPLTTVKLARGMLAGVPRTRVRTRSRPHRAGSPTSSACGSWPRRRDPGPAPAAAAARLRRGPVSDLLPAAAGGRLHRLAAAGRTPHLTARPSCLRSAAGDGLEPVRGSRRFGLRCRRPRDCGLRASRRRARASARAIQSAQRSPRRNSATPIESVTRPSVWPRSLSWTRREATSSRRRSASVAHRPAASPAG